MLSSGGWVTSTTLLKSTKQKYFDRRIRELRDELGYDIETGFQKGEACYRLKSKQRKPTKKRTYLGAAERTELLKNARPICAICGAKFSATKKPVFDHRVPLIRGGVGEVTNYQLLCHDCNNQKRSQCRGCTLECSKCYLAFPEKFPPAVMLRIQSKETYRVIDLAAKAAGLTIEEYCINVVTKSVK